MCSKNESFVSASLVWENINVSSKAKNSYFGLGKPSRLATQIIKNVSGEAPSGSSLAIMGSSGAGKSTLLNVLTARNLSNFAVEGTVKINGEVANVNKIKAMSGYVQQQDLFIATLTVREHLIFQALVRMDPSFSDVEKVQRVNEVMKELSLEKCADNLVGGTLATGKGISGGELKRLAFAAEILTKPSILFCDEPTSGLDSYMASTLVSFLDRMAAAGRTIICTIHQPASNVFSLFHNLLLMADGRVAYMGPTNEAPAFFASLNMICPPNYNPAEFYVKQLAEIPESEETCRLKRNSICDHFASREMKSMKKMSTKTTTPFESVVVSSPYKTSCWVQYQALAWRSYVCTMREPLLTYIRAGQALVMGFLLALFFYQTKYDQRGSFNFNAAIFFYLTCLTLINSLCVVNIFCSEMPIFLREHNSGMYTVNSYFVMRNVAELPFFTVIPLIYGFILYYPIGFNAPIDAFLYFTVVGIAISLVGVSYGYFFAAICNDIDMALSFGMPLFIPLMLLGGYYINSKTMPKGLSWAQVTSSFYFGFDLLMKNQWTNVDFLDCFPPSGLPGNVTLHPAFNVKNETHPPVPPLSPASLGCFRNGKDIMEFFDMGNKGDLGDFIGLCALFFILQVLAYLAIHVRAIFSR